MASNSTEAPAASNEKAQYDPHFTESVINAIGPNASPRVRQVTTSFIRHLHDFARENAITVDEFMTGLELMNEAGRMSNERRNEGQLLADIFGLESLVDEITYKLATDAKDEPTATAILGPFWRKDAPEKEMGDSIVQGFDSEGDRTWMHGVVTDFKTGKPIEGAVLDVWHTGPNGLYEQQDPNQPDMNLRGRFKTGKDGTYNFVCLRPVPYPIPFDGPAGKLLQALDRHPYRPAHIHFIVTAPGYKPIITQIFDRSSKYIENDAVFAVKDSLVVDFVPYKGEQKADFELPYDFKMAAYEEGNKQSLAGATEESTAGFGAKV